MVRLDSGTVVRRPLIGLDTALYRTVRLDRTLDRLLLANRLARVQVLEDVVHQDSVALAGRNDELRRCRLEGFAREVDYAKLAHQATQALALPTPKPLLLDPHTYEGGAAAVVVVTLLKLFVFPTH
ncbi:hypothetical protein AXW84_06110 [Hymenobacter sp. PAMC 26628]|nr:hypothetical protein AXW84_06110 [Hymenobacter sp. PAMC 26628]